MNDDKMLNIGFLKEKLVNAGFERNTKIKRLLLRFPHQFGISEKNSNTHVYIR
jgi:hypothetical protein